MVRREKDEKTTSWQNMMYHVEHKEDDSDEIHKRLDHAKKLGLIKAAFG